MQIHQVRISPVHWTALTWLAVTLWGSAFAHRYGCVIYFLPLAVAALLKWPLGLHFHGPASLRLVNAIDLSVEAYSECVSEGH